MFLAVPLVRSFYAALSPSKEGHGRDVGFDDSVDDGYISSWPAKCQNFDTLMSRRSRMLLPADRLSGAMRGSDGVTHTLYTVISPTS